MSLVWRVEDNGEQLSFCLCWPGTAVNVHSGSVKKLLFKLTHDKLMSDIKYNLGSFNTNPEVLYLFFLFKGNPRRQSSIGELTFSQMYFGLVQRSKERCEF